MKFKLLLLVLFLNINYTFSQNLVELDTYESAFFEKEYKISIYNDISLKKKKDINKYFIEYYIRTQPLSSYDSDLTTLIITYNKLEPFINYLNEIRVKYKEWKKTAIENNVKEIEKDFMIKSPYLQAGFTYSEWYYDLSVTLSSRFKYLDKIDNYAIIINSGELKSNSNSFIDSKGFALVFSSEEEIEDFINKLNNEKAIELIKSKEAKEDLFK